MENGKPVHGNYTSVIGALGSIFGFAGAVSLLVIRKFQLPKWPFTEENWNPKPTVEKTAEEKEKEVTKEEIEEDELAIAAGGLGKRSVEMERDWATEAGFYQYLRKRGSPKCVCKLIRRGGDY
jgi:hypothetical protein